MINKKYIENLFHVFLSGSDVNADNIIFIRGCSDYIKDYNCVYDMTEDSYKEGLYCHEFANDVIKTPYEPFFDAVRFFYNKFFYGKLSVDEFLEACDVYYLHREVFSTFINERHIKRSEIIIYSEIPFERKKFIDDIMSCLKYISEHCNVLFVLSNAQYAALGTLNVLERIIDDNSLSNVKFVIVYDELKFSQIESFEKDFMKLVHNADSKSILYDFESTKIRENEDYYSTFLASKKEFDRYIIELENLLQTLSIEDLEYYVRRIYNKLIEEKIDIPEDKKFRFYITASLCYLYKGDCNQAVVMCENMQNCLEKSENPKYEYIYNYILGQIHMTLSQIENSIKYALKCRDIGIRYNDEQMLFYEEILYQSAQFSGFRNVFLVDFSKIQVNKQIINKLREHKFYNTLSYYLIFGYDNDEESVRSLANGKISDTFKEAHELINMIGNTELLLSAYSKYIVILTEHGYPKTVKGLDDAKRKILQSTKGKNRLRLAHLYMGVGYNRMVGEDYDEANENFLKAIDILIELKKPEKVAEALYNMSQNSICAKDYKTCLRCMSTVFQILDNLNLETIQICSSIKLYAFMCIAYYKMGNAYRCLRYLNQMDILIYEYLDEEDAEQIDFSRDNEVLFLYFLIKAIFAKQEENLDLSLIYFKKAKAYFEGYSEVMFYAITFFISEYYDLLIELGEKDSADLLIDKAYDYCMMKGYEEKAEVFEAKKKNIEVEKCQIKNHLSSEKHEMIIHLSEYGGMEKQISAQKRDIRFLSSWQELLNHNDVKKETIISNAMSYLRDNFNLGGMAYIKYQDKTFKMMYKTYEVENDICMEIVDLFWVIKREFVINRTEKLFTKYEDFLRLLNCDDAFTIIGIPVYNENGLMAIFVGTFGTRKHDHTLLNEDDLAVIKTAIIQLNNAIDRYDDRESIISINSKLNELAVTDNLTGLFNRQGMAKAMEEMSSENVETAILYIDLDNFKYYNDNFGHDVGDIILKEFAKLFKKVAKEKGFAIRYGGDEFLIILKDTNIDVAKKTADDIYEYIHTKFMGIIRENIGMDIEIPKEKYISCSMGIMSSVDSSIENLEIALKKADEALYYMKRKSKGNYIVWDDMKNI